MTIISTSLLSFDDSAGLSSYTTGSISPVSNALILASVATTSVNVLPTRTLTGCGLTWIQLNEWNQSNSQLTLWYGSGTPSAGALTAGFSNSQSGCSILVDQLTGVDVVSTVGQSVPRARSSSASSLTVNLGPTPQTPADGAYGTFLSGGHFANGGTLSPGSGFSTVTSATGRTEQKALTEFASTYDSTVDASSAATAPMIGIALDIVARAGGGGVSINRILSG